VPASNISSTQINTIDQCNIRAPVIISGIIPIQKRRIYMAKYTASIDEGTRQRIHALPGRIHFADYMRKAISIFVEELEKNPDLGPENFIITVSAKKDTTRK